MAVRLLPCSSPLSERRLPYNWLAPRLAAISHEPHSLLFTAKLSTEHWTPRESESESESLYDWRFYRLSVRLGAKPLETHDQYLFFNWTLEFIDSPYVNILSDDRMGVCPLQLLLALASAVILEFESGHKWHCSCSLSVLIVQWSYDREHDLQGAQ
jgi:hypothetical protein